MTDTGQVCHYLEAASADMPGELAWASSRYTSTNINGTGTGIGTGRKNTALILAVDTAAPTAKACKEYTYGGKTDWFLPSQDELSMLYMCRNYVGGFNGRWYWSSSQSNYYGFAWSQYFSYGSQNDYGKTRADYVRAIRAF